MANRLEMANHDAILQLAALHWSGRRIARELGIDRATVARHLALTRCQAGLSNAAILPAGSEPPNAATFLHAPALASDTAAGRCPAAAAQNPNAANLPAGSCLGIRTAIVITGPVPAPASVGRPAPTTGSLSLCEPFRQVISEKLAHELSAQRIFQDLTAEHGYRGGYDSVKRFVRRLAGDRAPLPMRRLECAAGFEVQVDYGTGAPVIGTDGKRRKTHVLRIVLSHSRKAYSEASFRQTTEDFIRSLENAFWHFGGVPQTVVIDNLRAAVNHPDWYDPELNYRLRDFAAYYGTVILPTKPYTPRHKGKIERGVGYVKGNGLKGKTFTSLDEQNQSLAHWEEAVADRRIHGTTRQHVGKVFAEIERPALRPLPTERFPFFHEGERIVSRDGHVEVAKAYYSVPPEYLGRTVRVRWDARMVRVFNRHMDQITVHVRHEPGRFSTQGAHIAPEKISGVERGARWLMTKVSLIGPHTSAWAEAMLTSRGIEGTRVLMGLIALTKKHSSNVLEDACRAALSHAEFRLRALRALIARQPLVVQAALPFLDSHPLIRPLDDYARVVAAALERQHAADANSESRRSFTRHDSGVPCPRKEPNLGPLVADRGADTSGTRLRSGYPSPGCSSAEPGSVSPDNSSLRSLSPPLPGESSDE